MMSIKPVWLMRTPQSSVDASLAYFPWLSEWKCVSHQSRGGGIEPSGLGFEFLKARLRLPGCRASSDGRLKREILRSGNDGETSGNTSRVDSNGGA